MAFDWNEGSAIWWQDNSVEIRPGTRDENNRTKSELITSEKRISCVKIVPERLDEEFDDFLTQYFRTQYKFPFVDKVMLVSPWTMHNPDLIMVLAPRIRELNMLFFVGFEGSTGEKIIRNLSSEFEFFEMEGASLEHNAFSMIRPLFENEALVEFGIRLNHVELNAEDTMEFIKSIKRSTKIISLDLVSFDFDWKDLIGDWTPSNSIKSIALQLQTENWDINGLNSILTNCRALKHLKLSVHQNTLQCQKVVEIVESVVSLSSINSFEFIFFCSFDPVLLGSQVSPILMESSIKKLNISFCCYVEEFENPNLEELHCWAIESPASCRILEKCANLRFLSIYGRFSQTGRSISSMLSSLETNQNLTALYLPNREQLQDKEFSQLFNVLKQNSALRFLHVSIDLCSSKHPLALLDYMESNSGGLEILELFCSSSRDPDGNCSIVQILESLSRNRHIYKFGVNGGSFLPFQASFDCVSGNHGIVELGFVLDSAGKIEDALTRNRQLFQKECRLLLIHKISFFSSAHLMERDLLKTIFQMSSNV
jgi:hypothetical protein